MTITQEIIDRTREFEGAITWMYLDTTGNVTVGAGHLLADASAASALDFVDKDNPSTHISDSQKRADFATVDGMEAGHLAAYYRNATRSRITVDSINELLETDLTAVETSLQGRLTAYNSYPGSAQAGLIDMAFNLGIAKLFRDFPTFVAAVRRTDWAVAASESHRRGISDARNDTIRDLFLAAEGGHFTSTPRQIGGQSIMGTTSIGSLLLNRFCWPLIVAAISVTIATLGVCPYQGDNKGAWESTYDSVVVSFAAHFWFMSGYLFTLTFLGALAGPSLRWIWNRRLEDYVVHLRNTGREAESVRESKKAITPIRWIWLKAMFLVGLASVVAATGDFKHPSDPTDASGKTVVTSRALAEVPVFLKNCCACSCTNGEPQSDSSEIKPVAKTAGSAGASCLSHFKIAWISTPTYILLAILSCGMILLFEWVAAFAGFLFFSSRGLEDSV